MRSYAQIVPTFWTRGSGRKLRGNQSAQVLVLYFMTAPSSNLIGLYYLPLTTICHETGLSAEEVRAAMALPAVAEIVQYDFDQEIVWLPECARYQLGEAMAANDKRRPAVERELAVFERHAFWDEFVYRYAGPFGLRIAKPTKGHAEAADAPPKGLPEKLEPPFPAPAPVLDPVPAPEGVQREPSRAGPPAAPETQPAPDYTDSEFETVIPLDLIDRARRLDVFGQMLAKMPGVERIQLEDKAREVVSYWTIGGGAGQRRRFWMRRLREDLRKAYENGQLRPVGAIEHALHGAGDERATRERKRGSDAMAAAYATAPREGSGTNG